MKLIDLVDLDDIWDDWRSRYKTFVPRFIKEAISKDRWEDWDPDVFHEYFERSDGQCVSSLRQGYFIGDEKDKIKSNWQQLAPMLKKIAQSQDVPLFDTYHQVKKWIAQFTSRNRKAATNRLIAGLQPRLLCTIVKEADLDNLIEYLHKVNIEDCPPNEYDWFKNSYNILQFFKNEIPHEDITDLVTLPWQT